MGKGAGGLRGGDREYGEKCWSVERCKERDRRLCEGVGRGKERCGKCVGVWREVRVVRRSVEGGVGRGVEDVVECGRCGKVC